MEFNDKLMNEITKNLGITRKQVITVLELLDEGNTVPFIARYRKEVTGALDEEQIRDIHRKGEYQKISNCDKCVKSTFGALHY